MRAALYILGSIVVALILGTILDEPGARNSATTMILMGWTTFLPSRVPRATFNWNGVGLMLLCLALVAGLTHNFCSWLWRSGSGTGTWRPKWTAAGLAVVILLFVAGMAVTGVVHQVGWLITEPPRYVARSLTSPLVPGGLRAILKAQQEFRDQDRDGNGRKDYWRQDIAGLHGLVAGGQAIKLLELTVAMADDRSRTDLSPVAHGNTLPFARAGYFFRALRFEDESDASLSPDRFAVCAIPSSFSAGSAVFILSDAGTLYVQRYEGGKPPDVYPADPEKSGWYRIE